MIFGVFCTCMTIHVFFFFPETAGKTLEEVEEIFLSDTKAWQTRVHYRDIVMQEHGDGTDAEKRLSYAPGSNAKKTDRMGSEGTAVGEETVHEKPTANAI